MSGAQTVIVPEQFPGLSKMQRAPRTIGLSPSVSRLPLAGGGGGPPVCSTGVGTQDATATIAVSLGGFEQAMLTTNEASTIMQSACVFDVSCRGLILMTFL